MRCLCGPGRGTKAAFTPAQPAQSLPPAGRAALRALLPPAARFYFQRAAQISLRCFLRPQTD